MTCVQNIRSQTCGNFICSLVLGSELGLPTCQVQCSSIKLKLSALTFYIYFLFKINYFEKKSHVAQAGIMLYNFEWPWTPDPSVPTSRVLAPQVCASHAQSSLLCVYPHKQVQVHMCRGQRTTTGPSPQVLFIFYLRQALSLTRRSD